MSSWKGREKVQPAACRVKEDRKMRRGSTHTGKYRSELVEKECRESGNVKPPITVSGHMYTRIHVHALILPFPGMLRLYECPLSNLYTGSRFSVGDAGAQEERRPTK